MQRNLIVVEMRNGQGKGFNNINHEWLKNERNVYELLYLFCTYFPNYGLITPNQFVCLNLVRILVK